MTPRYLAIPRAYGLFVNTKQPVGSISMIVLKMASRINSDCYYQDLGYECVDGYNRAVLFTMCELADIFTSETKCK